jgi:oligoendopeptidase F
MKLKSHFSENELIILEAFKLEDEINQKVSKLILYAKLEYYGDNKKKKKKLQRMNEKNSILFAKISFIRPELLSLSNEKLLKFRDKASIIYLDFLIYSLYSLIIYIHNPIFKLIINYFIYLLFIYLFIYY